MLKLGCIQENVDLGKHQENVQSAKTWLKKAKEDGVELAVFPEAFLTGYCVDNIDDAEKIALHCQCNKSFDVDEADQPIVELQSLCIDLDIHAVVGFAGKDKYGLYNAAILFEPDGRMRRYIKTHLPCLGFDRFVLPGSALPVFQTEIGAIGIQICYDLRHPEPFRVLAMAGADLIVLPTNWPAAPHAERDALCKARAVENKIYLASCNRLGDENGTSFRGMSGIYGFDANVLAQAGDEPTLITAELDLVLTRNKRNVFVPGLYETTLWESRRPELYQPLVK